MRPDTPEQVAEQHQPPVRSRRLIVEVRGLVKQYGETCAVNDLSLEIEEGEIFGFIGPNGAGKTTTLRILATLLEPTSGDVWIDGKRLDEHSESIRRVIGYMPDYFGVYEGITVEEYLEFFAAAYKLPAAGRAAVLEGVMELTDLGGLRSRMVASLSRGMKQRLCLAKTLVHDPKVLWQHKRVAVYGTEGFVHWTMNSWELCTPSRGYERGEKSYGDEDVLGQAAMTDDIFACLEDDTKLHGTRLDVSLAECNTVLGIYKSALDRVVLALPFEPEGSYLAECGKVL